jgi:hypothetical protein
VDQDSCWFSSATTRSARAKVTEVTDVDRRLSHLSLCGWPGTRKPKWEWRMDKGEWVKGKESALLWFALDRLRRLRRRQAS